MRHDKTNDSLASEGTRYLRKKPLFSTRAAYIKQGRELAARLRTRSIDLQYDKATEFSPDIRELALLAAKIALIAYGKDSPELAAYEGEVYYYRHFDPQHPIVVEYDRFKSTL